jgi:CheY-like chemotaxis protein
MVALSNISLKSEAQPVEVLLVEDEAISRRALSTLLDSKGFNTTSAGSAEEALQLLSDGAHPRCALVDLDLPGMNGLDLISRLAAQHPAIPAILITASSFERLKELLDGQYIRYMRKPLDFSRLVEMLATGPCNS